MALVTLGLPELIGTLVSPDWLHSFLSALSQLFPGLSGLNLTFWTPDFIHYYLILVEYILHWLLRRDKKPFQNLISLKYLYSSCLSQILGQHYFMFQLRKYYFSVFWLRGFLGLFQEILCEGWRTPRDHCSSGFLQAGLCFLEKEHLE